MQFLLPPSETKRDGGANAPLELDRLSFPSLTDARRAALAALSSLCVDGEAAARALKLSATAAPPELARNRAVEQSPTMSAIERYTGVLYDALGVAEWRGAARERASQHLIVHSALFGLVRADDPIPAYRLSCDSRLPGPTMRARWSALNAEVLASLEGPLIDLRSESYAALGPLPDRRDAVFVRVVAVGADGVARALNHFNKKGKGEYLQTLFAAGTVPTTIEGLCRRSTALGWPLSRTADRELQLIVPGVLPAR